MGNITWLNPDVSPKFYRYDPATDALTAWKK
jgi:hypothetical protein